MYKKNLLLATLISLSCSGCIKPLPEHEIAQKEKANANTNSDQLEESITRTESINPETAEDEINRNKEKNLPKKPVTIQLPKLIDEISLLVHPIVPVDVDKKGFADKIMTPSADYRYGKGKEMSSPDGLNKVATLTYQTYIHNLVFESKPSTKSTLTTFDNPNNSTENQNNNLSKTTTKTTTKIATNNHYLFNHNNFLITSIFYPHSFKKRAVVCYEQDKNQQHCTNIESYDIKTNANQIIVKEEVIKKELFGKFIYKIQEQQLTDEQLREVEGNLHAHQSLYMSDEDGRFVTKMHPDGQYLTDSEWVADLKRYYFSTRTDSNKNKVLDLKDKQFNYVIDFNNEMPKATLYTPM